MKRLKRNPAEIGALDLADGLSAKLNVQLADIGRAFSFDEAIAKAKGNDRLMHGKRTENMFEYVIASLGQAKLIKKEDAGEITAHDDELLAPDYFVALKDGSRYLVEVKNCRMKSISSTVSLNVRYVSRLRRYADIMGYPVLLAVYWSNFRVWTINSIADIVGDAGSVNLGFVNAMKLNMASAFGDRMIQSVPPIVCRLWADPKHRRAIDSNGQVQFTIEKITFYSAGDEITDSLECNLAYYFMFHSDWVELSSSVKMDGDLLDYVEMQFGPEEGSEVEGQIMQSLGSLGGMISSFYNWRTLSPSNEILRLTPDLQPGELGCVLPSEFEGRKLKLWIISTTPNHDPFEVDEASA